MSCAKPTPSKLVLCTDDRVSCVPSSLLHNMGGRRRPCAGHCTASQHKQPPGTLAVLACCLCPAPQTINRAELIAAAQAALIAEQLPELQCEISTDSEFARRTLARQGLPSRKRIHHGDILCRAPSKPLSLLIVQPHLHPNQVENAELGSVLGNMSADKAAAAASLAELPCVRQGAEAVNHWRQEQFILRSYTDFLHALTKFGPAPEAADKLYGHC